MQCYYCRKYNQTPMFLFEILIFWVNLTQSGFLFVFANTFNWFVAVKWQLHLCSWFCQFWWHQSFKYFSMWWTTLETKFGKDHGLLAFLVFSSLIFSVVHFGFLLVLFQISLQFHTSVGLDLFCRWQLFHVGEDWLHLTALEFSN